MYLKILEWIYHGKSEKNKSFIFSIDIQPFENKIITCGHDSLIKIWGFPTWIKMSNFKKKIPTCDPIFSKSQTLFSPIFIIEINSKTSNVIRWANNGQRFAVGGDSGSLVIYESREISKKQINWGIYHEFTNHFGDITDISWCFNCCLLASASLDNTVLIWSLKKKCLVVKLLGHFEWVKGVSWDPTGHLLASKSENKKIIIWNTRKWKSVKTLYRHMTFGKNFTSFNSVSFDRMSWTPCGNFLLINENRNKNKLEVYERFNNFNKSMNVILKNQEINLIIPSTRFYKNPLKISKITSLVVICSSTGGINFWCTTKSRLLVSFKHLPKSKIIDGNWSHCGYNVLFAYSNGNVLLVKFKKKEIGEILYMKNHFQFVKKFWRLFFKKKIESKISKYFMDMIFQKKLKSIKDNSIKKKIQSNEKNLFFDLVLKRKKYCLSFYVEKNEPDLPREISKITKNYYKNFFSKDILNKIGINSDSKKFLEKRKGSLFLIGQKYYDVNPPVIVIKTIDSFRKTFFILMRKSYFLFFNKRKKLVRPKTLKLKIKISTYLYKKKLLIFFSSLGDIYFLELFRTSLTFFRKNKINLSSSKNTRISSNKSLFFLCSGIIMLSFL